MIGTKYTVHRMLKKVGVIGGQGRIYNEDTSTYFLGYVSVNPLATTPFSRTIVHKAWFEGESTISNGDLILDRADNNYYLVMSLKREIVEGVCIFIDGTLYLANKIVSIHRFSDGTKNFFGKDSDPAPTPVYSNVRVMINPNKVDVLEQPDRNISQDKIKIVLPSKFIVKSNDRITTNSGNNYIVITADNESLEGLVILTVDTDTR